MKSILFFGILCVVLLTSCLPSERPTTLHPTPQPTSSGNGGGALLTFGPPSSLIPEGFVGFNVELSDICIIVQTYEQEGSVYEHLYTRLGTGVIHVGGHTADIGIWDAYGVSSCDQKSPIITQDLLKRFFSFVQRIGWKVSWTLPLIPNDLQNIIAEATSVAKIGNTSVAAFSIGNEPELYIKRGERPLGWGYADYLREWKYIHQAVHIVAPSVAYQGPDACCNGSLFENFLNDGGMSLLAATHHYYIRSYQVSSPIADLLSQQTSQKFSGEVQGWVTLAHAHGLPLYITEANSISNGGSLGVTNTFAAALWLIDTMMQAAVSGVQQFDLQEAPGAFYNAISDSGTPTVLYQALLFVHSVTSSHHIIPIQGLITWPALAFATQDNTGHTHIVLVNNSLDKPMTINIGVSKAAGRLQAQRLEAESISSTSSVSLKSVSVIVRQGVANVVLPAGSTEDIIIK